MSNTVAQAEQLLMRVERECKEVGLLLNSSKTKAIYTNTEVETLKNEDLEEIKQALTIT